MLLEPCEAFRDLPAPAADDLCDDRPGIVEPDLRRDTPDVLEDRFHGFQQALHVLTIVELEEPAVAVGEIQDKVFTRMAHAVLIEIRSTEVALRFSRAVVQGDEAFFSFKVQLKFLLFDILGYEPVGAVEAVGLLPEPLEDSFCCVALFPRGFFVFRQPAVNERFEGIQFRTEVLFRRHGIRFVEISHVNIFTDCFPVQTSASGDLRYVVQPLPIIELSDTMYLIHC